MDVEDLSADPLLKAAARMHWDGGEVPSVGGLALLRRLGRGGMGVVYFGFHPGLGVPRAVKFLPAADAQRDARAVRRFLREARLAASIQHPHLVQTLDVSQDEATGLHYLVMEYVDGVPASAFLAPPSGTVGPLQETEALDLLLAVTEGMAAAHRLGIVHRDLKPPNLLVPAGAGGGFRFAESRVSDLGLARSEEVEGELTDSRMGMGTAGYMAPEQWIDVKHAKKPADVFGLGATLYALLAGRSPFARASRYESQVATMRGEYVPIGDAVPGVSRGTQALIATCLQVKESERFPDAPALLEALHRVRDSLGERTMRDWAPAMTELTRRAEEGLPVRNPTPTPSAASGEAGDLQWEKDLTPTRRVTPIQPARGKSGNARGPSRQRRVGALLVVAPVAAIVIGLALWSPWRDRTAPGLLVESEPSGATVVVDGTERGRTPLLLGELAEGRHTVLLQLEHYRTFETREAEFRRAERTSLSARLERTTGTISVTGGTPRASLRLVRDRPPPKEYGLRLDPKGRLPLTTVEVGDYLVTGHLEGHADFQGRCSVRESTSTAIPLLLTEKDGILTVDSDPQGALVIVDGVALGVTPLKEVAVRPGLRTLELKKSKHVGHEAKVEFRPGQATELPAIHLVAWGWLDLAEIPAGVSVSFGDGSPAEAGMRLPPGRTTVVLRREGHVNQILEVLLTSGTSCPVRPGPWVRDCGTIRLPPLDPGVEVRIGGRLVQDGEEIPSGTHEFSATRPGHIEQVLRLKVEAGKSASLELRPWKRDSGSVSLKKLDSDVTVTVEGSSLREGSVLATGVHTFVLAKPGHASQSLQRDVPRGGTLVLVAEPWEGFLAVLSFTGLTDDTEVYFEGRKAVGPLTLPRAGIATVEFRRDSRGYKRQSVETTLILGRTVSASPGEWEGVPGLMRVRPEEDVECEFSYEESIKYESWFRVEGEPWEQQPWTNQPPRRERGTLRGGRVRPQGDTELVSKTLRVRGPDLLFQARHDYHTVPLRVGYEVPFPDAAVTVGSTWTAPFRFDSSSEYGEREVSATFRVISSNASDITMDVSGVAKGVGGWKNSKSLSWELHGRLVVSARDGLLVSAELIADVTSEWSQVLIMSGGERPTGHNRSKSTTVLTVRRIR